MFSVRQGWEHVCELSMVKPGQPTGVAQLYDINSLHKWPKMTLAVTSAVTFSLTLGKHYFCLLYLKKKPWQNLACWSGSQCLRSWPTLFVSLLWIAELSPVAHKRHRIYVAHDVHIPFTHAVQVWPSELTNTDSRNRSVPQKRMDILSFLPLVFLQIKVTFV